MKKCIKCTYDNEDRAQLCIRCGAELISIDKDNHRPNDVIFQEEPLHLEEDVSTYLEKNGTRSSYTQEDEEENDYNNIKECNHSSTEIFGASIMDGGRTIHRCSYCGAYNTSDIKSCCSCGALLQNASKKNVNEDRLNKVKQNRHKPINQKSYHKPINEKPGQDSAPSVERNREIKVKKQTVRVAQYIQSSIQNKRNMAIITVGILLILILGISSFSPDKAIAFYDNKAMDYIWEETGVSFYTNEKMIARIEDNIEKVIFSLDRTKAVVLTEMPSSKIGGDLYLIEDNKKIQLLDYGVVSVVFAANGEATAYYKDYNENDKTASLYYSTGKDAIMIEENMPVFLANLGLTISPEGNSVGYYIYDGNNGEGYISTKGKQGKLFGENKKIIALADKADYVYYVKDDQKGKSKLDNLYVKHYNLDTKLYGINDHVYDIYFNNDYSQVLYIQTDGTFISVEGKDKEKLLNQSLYPIFPRLMQERDEESYKLYGIQDFEGKVYHGEEALYYFSDHNRLQKIGNNVDGAIISKDLKTLVYQDTEANLYWTKGIKESNSKINKINVNGTLWDYVVTDHGDYIYYVNRYGELFQIKPGKEEKQVSSEASAYLQLSGDVLYFLYDYQRNDSMRSTMKSNQISQSTGMLCYIEDGERKMIPEADGIQYMYALGDGIIYSQGTYLENSLWGVSKKQKKNLLLENVNTYQ